MQRSAFWPVSANDRNSRQLAHLRWSVLRHSVRIGKEQLPLPRVITGGRASPGAAAESRAVPRISCALTTGDQIDRRSDRNVPIGHDRAFIDGAVCVRDGKGGVDDRGITVQRSRHARAKTQQGHTRAIRGAPVLSTSPRVCPNFVGSHHRKCLVSWMNLSKAAV